MRIDIVSIFPEIFEPPFSRGVVRVAREKGVVEIVPCNLRDFAKNSVVDDSPYGGGPGMILKSEPIFEAVEKLRRKESRLILLTPQGSLFNQNLAKELAAEKHLILICGRYKGVDERVSNIVTDEISIGDYILSGGEFVAMVIVDAVVRLLPGVLGDFSSATDDSFYGVILDAPYYTRPDTFKEHSVPGVLTSGNHRLIRKWRRKEALRRTFLRRPELLEKANLTEEDKKMLEEIKSGKD